jgi:phospholipase C
MSTVRGCAVVLAAATVLGVAAFAFGGTAALAAAGKAPRAAGGMAVPSYQRSIGVRELAAPDGVAATASGDIWVADTGHDRIVEFSGDGGYLTAVSGSLDEPEGIAVDAAGDVWVASTGGDQIVEFSASGSLLARFGGAGSGHGQLDQPVALTVAGGVVYVADQDNNRIEEFTTTGAYRGAISVATPAGVALDRRDDIWVSSPGYADGNTICEFSAAGKELTSFGTTQAGYGDLGDTGGIAIGAGGKIFVAQPDYGWVTVFGADGDFAAEFGLPSGALQNPQSLALTPAGDVYVADSGTSRIAEFGPAAAALGSGRGPVVGHGGSGIPLVLIAVLLAALLGAAGATWYLLSRRRAATHARASARASALPPPSAAVRPAQVTQASGFSRRTLLMSSATALSGVAVAGALPLSLRRQVARTLDHPVQGDLSSIEHIVILMQENRSFDHYFGTFPGVRGFADPAAIRLPDGTPVFRQPDPGHPQGYLAPFRYDTRSTSAQATPSTDHTWPTQHQAWNGGKMDQWVKAKGPYTMGYFTQADIPFHWALAEAFTLCDNYHCSVFGPTNPNRLYMWTGMIDPGGTAGGPVIDNTPAYDNVILSWTTYPERLQRAGISWQVYQEEDNYDDNALAWFKHLASAPRSSPLWQRAIRKGQAGWFEADARAGNLPQVSWIVAPTAQSEHPDYFPAAGAEYIASKLDAIASNPGLWSKTLFILTYDENDGLFDHVPPPVPPAGTAAEFVNGEPIGLGFRVPAMVISPWSAGGRICSDVMDHTSLIRIIERVFGVTEPNISDWRRRTCGDFTGALRFGGPVPGYPRSGPAISLASAEAGLLTAQGEVFANPAPVVPAANEPLPGQA